LLRGLSVGLTVSVLRELFRNYQAFWALYESEGIDVVEAQDGTAFSLWDAQYLYRQIRHLPPRQQQAIQLCLIENMKESDAALKMGVSETNPVAMYATSGLEKLVQMVQEGQLPRFREEELREAVG
jgi:DNA-directed RNA polymerase specialized sigma24 family protein